MRILAFAYACDPEHGSEPGAGWAWARLLARMGETWVITRTNNRDSIERRLASTPEGSRLRFVYVDLPPWARRWKKGGRGARVYYMLWQVAAARQARQLKRQTEFDLYWHLTFANVWLGATAAIVGRPFVYGPVGGGVATPWGFLRSMGTRGAIMELGRTTGRTVAKWLNPLAILTWARADLVLSQNPDTLDWLPRRIHGKAEVFPNSAIDDELLELIQRFAAARPIADGAASKTAIFAGRLIPLKGCDLAIRAVGETDDWRLVICGSGPDKQRLTQLSTSLSLDDRVDFVGHQPRERVVELMVNSDVMLFPSLHDEAPFAVAEARACGLATICLDRGGPPVIAGESAVSVRATEPDGAVRALGAALMSVQTGLTPRQVDQTYSLDAVQARIHVLLERHGLLGRGHR